MANAGFFDVLNTPKGWFSVDSTVLGWFDKSIIQVPYAVPLTYRRAILWNGSIYIEITDDLVGTGLKPLVLLDDGTIKERSASEGTPVILIDGILKTLNTATEQLKI